MRHNDAAGMGAITLARELSLARRAACPRVARRRRSPQGLLAERHESQLESRWIVFCRLREVRLAEVWAPPMAVSRLLAEARWSISWVATSEITRSHRLTAELPFGQPFAGVGFETEGGEKVREHYHVLQL